MDYTIVKAIQNGAFPYVALHHATIKWTATTRTGRCFEVPLAWSYQINNLLMKAYRASNDYTIPSIVNSTSI
jgi:hypothetical protein